jgi:hypothetical protein
MGFDSRVEERNVPFIGCCETFLIAAAIQGGCYPFYQETRERDCRLLRLQGIGDGDVLAHHIDASATGDTHDHQSLFSHNQCRKEDFDSIEGFHCGRGEVKECGSLPKTLLPGTALQRHVSLRHSFDGLSSFNFSLELLQSFFIFLGLY